MKRHNSSPQIQKATAPERFSRTTPTTTIATADDRTHRGDHACADAEQQHVGRRHPVHRHANDGAEREHAREPIAEDRTGQQVVHDVMVATPFPLHLDPERAIGAEDANGRRAFFRVEGSGRDEKREREQGEPRSRQKHRGSDVLAVVMGNRQHPAGIAVTGDEAQIHDDQQPDTAEVTCR
jgi:hypothetical protein